MRQVIFAIMATAGMFPFCVWTATSELQATPPRPLSVALVPPPPGPAAPVIQVRSVELPSPMPIRLDAYAYSETPADPVKIALADLHDTPEGSPRLEIARAADAFGLSHRFMDAVARIESDFDPRNRTGSYIGLFQLSDFEFKRYGGEGSITDARDNAMAAAFKFVSEAVEFEFITHRVPSPSDLYLIHQQGEQGAAEHIEHPDWPAWKSMCATDEGRQKGESWCKRAIWENTLPVVKQTWRSVDNLTSAAFVAMWTHQVDRFIGVAATPFLAPPKLLSTPIREARYARHRRHHHIHLAGR